MHTSGHQCILFYFLFQIMVDKKHGKQNRKKVWNSLKAFSLRTIKICRFGVIDGVKYVYGIKHVYNFLLREQVGFAAVLWRLRQCVSCWYHKHLFFSEIATLPLMWKIHIFSPDQFYNTHRFKPCMTLLYGCVCY